MPKRTVVLNNFTGGEMSPLMDARSDIGKYQSGCRILQNMIVYPQGGAFKRPGTEFIREVPDSDNITRLIPFQYSDTDSYILEFSNYLLRFYRTVSGTPGIILTGGGAVYSIPTPYTSAQLAIIQYVQSGDVMYLTHPSHRPRKLSRIDHNKWSLSTPEFMRGPFMAQNDTETRVKVKGYNIDAADHTANPDTLTISDDGDLSELIQVGDTITVTGSTANDGDYLVSGTSYAAPDFTITLSEALTDSTADGVVNLSTVAGRRVQVQASPTIWQSGHVGALWGLTYNLDASNVTGTFTATGTSSTMSVALGQTIDFFTHGAWTATVALEVSYDNGNTWEGIYQVAYRSDGNIELHHIEEIDDALYRINCSAYTSGTVKYNMATRAFKQQGIIQIDTFTDGALVEGIIKTDIAKSNVFTKLWSEGSWSDYRGWPRAITFYEQRLWFGGTAWEPTTLWSSRSLPGGDYENFLAGADDDAALNYTLVESQQDPIKWLSSDKGLVVGTAGSEYTLGASATNEPITPTNVSHPDRQGVRGSASIGPIRSDLGHLFIERGARKVRELVYNWEVDKFVTSDMTRLSDHISEGGITEVALQKRPETVLWCITGDGNLIGLTYLRTENIVAWHRHVTEGSFESVAVIPGTEEDELWVVVNRTINSATKRYVERFKTWTLPDDQDDDFFVDCGYTYDSTATDTITGLTHLESETVRILADGSNHADKTVSSGSITLDRNAATVQVGLAYTAQLKPMKLPLGSAGPDSVKRVSHYALNFYQTNYAQIGSSESDLDEIIFRESDDLMDAPPPRYTGYKDGPFPGGYEREGTMLIQSDKPMPLTVLSLVAIVEAE